MSIRLNFTGPKNMHIKSVNLIQSQDKPSDLGLPMKQIGDEWVIEKSFPPGEHHYAFLVNGNLKLNDPMANMYAPDDQEKIWSVLLIDSKGQRLYNNTQYTTHIETYTLTSHVTDQKGIPSKKAFNRLTDDKVAARLTFKKVTGLHNVTLAWYKPNGSLHQWSEQFLLEPENPDEPIDLWFWMNLKGEKRILQSGSWILKLFIDGAFILEDAFTISESSTYAPLIK